MACTEPPETTQHEDSMAANGPDRIREQEQFTLLSQKINDQADALPSPAMDIFSRHLRTVRITQLAPELLSDIFGYFQHPALHENRINMDCINARFPRDHFQALKSLRLTCSLFNQIATPLLLPILRVQVGKPSLDRIQAIAKNSLLSAGLRGIQVHMGCRFKTLALDETEFFSYQRGHVNQLLNYHAMFLKHWIDKATGDGTGQALLWSDERFTTLERIRACVLACDRYLGREALSTPRISSLPYDALPELLKEPVDDELVAEYQKVLYQAHQDYRVGYERDWPVVSNGSLVDALAQLVSMSLRPVSLSFDELPQWKQQHFIFTDKDQASRWLGRPTRPSEAWKLEGKPIEDDLVAHCGLLWNLPIHIHQTGSLLNSLEIKSLVVSQGYNMIGAPTTLAWPRWSQLQVACQYLQTLTLTSLHFDYRLQIDRYPINITTTEDTIDQASIGKYISTVLSGRALKRIELDASTPGLRSLSRGGTRCPLVPILGQMSCQHVRLATLINVGISQKELEIFAKSLSPAIEPFSMEDVWLTQGSWVPVLDLLRDMFKERYTREKCQVQLKLLSGGELRRLAIDNSEDKLNSLTKLMELFMEYIEGYGVSKNPAILE